MRADRLALPIDPLLPEIVRAARERGAVVVQAEPGAGKTTRVPSALLEAFPGRVLVLEPRRLAARLAAERVAHELGERAGETVGYQTRFDERTGPRTRLVFMTEGILAWKLLRDPLLESVSAVVLDEFHERHLEGDLALALLARARRERPDLRLAVMSATLEAGPVASFLGAVSLSAPGKTFPVEIEHEDRGSGGPLEERVRSALARILEGGLDGDVLVFLPGAAEIRATLALCSDLARERGVVLFPLHGRLSPDEQDRALGPSARRKVIFSTNVAETSITIEGVTCVLDSGLARVAGHSSWSGLPTLEVEPISRASAKQRAGRAGRTRPGRCIRLYSKADHDARPAFAAPEIARVDLAGTVLALEAAGLEPRELSWLEPPPSHALETALDLLGKLGAVEDGGITPVGKKLLELPLHPRLARMVVDAFERGVAAEAVAIAALLTERSIGAFSLGDRAGEARRGRKGPRGEGSGSDVLAMLERFEAAREARFAEGPLAALGIDPLSARAVDRVRVDLAKRVRAANARSELEPDAVESALGRAILAGHPDRIAQRRPGGALLLQDGRSAELARESEARDASFLVLVDAQERAGREPLVRLASAIEPGWVLDAFPGAVRETVDVTWDARLEKVLVASRLLHGALVLDESERAPDERARVEIGRALAREALKAGPEAFAPKEALDELAARAELARSVDARVPELGDARAREVLAELASTRRSFRELREADLLSSMTATLGHEERRSLERIAPGEVSLPGGRRLHVHYARGQAPWVESRLQDFFGLAEGPRVGGSVPLVLHLLSPARRPVQITQDLAGFWSKHYPGIRRELARRYPKHDWPEDPLRAKPPPPTGKRR